jgi:putative SOS response-associated peptidase YedK
MCNRYNPPEWRDIERFWEISRRSPNQWWTHQPQGPMVAPLRAGPYVKAGGELEIGQWGMIPPSSKTQRPMTSAGKPMSTNNARTETIQTAWTFKFPWKDGKRCLIPAASYDEPYWGPLFEPFPKTIWWRFARADGHPWALAGLWNEWVDPESGEIVPNYAMLTMNCDSHPLLNKFHKPERDKAGNILPADKHDKRSVISIEREDWDTWLHGTQEQAMALFKTPPAEVFAHGAADPAQSVKLAI